MKYFTINELSLSSTAQKYLIDNTPDKPSIANMTLLVDHILDPIREAWGKPIKINSGYRSKALNSKIGGSKTSDHMLGRAADITAGSTTQNKKLFDLILTLGLQYDQLIDEKGYKWIHISYRPVGNRNQILHLK